MKYDTISFIVDAVPNEYYGSEGSEYLTPDHRDLKITVVLNDVRVGWKGHVDVYSLATRNLDHRPFWDDKYLSGWSVYQPFSCSCGEAGCAGIWDGIYVKERGHSVEWRANPKDGYGFLLKSFFNFEKVQYKWAFNSLLSEIEHLSNGFDFTLVVEAGYCEGGLVTGLDFLKWVKEQQK
jgi:hypothetical protein